MQTFIIYIRFANEGSVKCHFLGLAKLSEGTVEAILETLLVVMELRQLPIAKLNGIAGDGPNIMTGTRQVLQHITPFVIYC